MSTYRIQQLTSREAGERPKGYNNTYRFVRNDVPVYQGHVYRWCMKPSEFVPVDGNPQGGFVLRPSRPVMPTTWIVEAVGSRQRYGALKRKLFGKVDWKLRDAKGRQLATFVGCYERRFWLIRFIDVFMGGSLPYRYEIVSKGETLATMDMEERPNPAPKEKKGFFAKLVGKVLVDKDWVIREKTGKEGRLDHRLVLSGAVLLDLISRDISGVD